MTGGAVRYARNREGRDFIVGDIHGMFGLLNKRLASVCFDYDRDRLFCVGDLVDRGEGSRRVRAWLRQPWLKSVRGNHEQAIVDWLSVGVDREWHEKHGGAWFYELSKSDRIAISRAFAQLPFAIELETTDATIGIVHAEVFGDWRCHCADLDIDLGVIAAADLFRRKRWREQITEPVGGIDAVVVGHVIVPEVTALGNTLYIDTGAYKTGELTLIEVDEALARVRDSLAVTVGGAMGE